MAHHTLIRGSVHPDVGKLHDDLAAAGFPVEGDKHNTYGEATEAAVTAFQEANGLDADGAYGPDTGAALKAAVEAADQPEEPEPAEPADPPASKPPAS